MLHGRRIRVAIFLTSFDPGGSEQQMIELTRRLDRAHFDVHVACLHRRGAWLSRVADHCASVTEFPLRGFLRVGSARQVLAYARWCRRLRVQVLQTSDFYTNVFGLAGAALASVPVRIGSRRGMNHDRTRQQRAAQAAAYRLAHHVVANSAAVAAQLAREWVPVSRIVTIANGIDPDRFPPRTPDEREPRITTVANLRAGKGHEDLIEAAASVLRVRPDVVFQLVGDGPRRGELETLVARRGLATRVRFLGHREDVPALLAGSAAFVLPSWSEAFPNGVLEAMATGLPVVATAVDGIPELVHDGVNGRLVPAHDPASLADAVLGMVEDPVGAARLGSTARDDVAAKFSLERMVRRFEHLYLSALSHGGTAPLAQAA